MYQVMFFVIQSRLQYLAMQGMRLHQEANIDTTVLKSKRATVQINRLTSRLVRIVL